MCLKQRRHWTAEKGDLTDMTILNTTAITTPRIWVFLAGLLMLMIGLIAAEVSKDKPHETSIQLFVGGVIVIACGAMLTLLVFFGRFDRETGKTRYEVLLNDKVAFTDVMDCYEIIEHRGDIWVLEDKGEN